MAVRAAHLVLLVLLVCLALARCSSLSRQPTSNHVHHRTIFGRH
ncbi:hypothetical protein BLL52_2889 [Rhodoferax antarcticus ANT.BR]|uniref:Uncharacterized protein n=1 Tax=Rhodoferax antarcticus ANT.BR TaxID=1111071 RepID=A0A1Q8YF57_9BURK|nr:hypothetical protein BLL52_2889 [Rhodoferax antarcticus ANT.BR]